MSAKFLGTTDDVTTCDCCGRKGLKSTVALELAEATDPVYYGVTCAAKALRMPAREVKASASHADRERAEQERRARNAAADAAAAPWFAFLAAEGKGDDTFRRIESLGGYAAARALFASRVAAVARSGKS